MSIISSSVGERTWIRAFSEISESEVGDDVFIGFHCLVRGALVENGAMLASRVVLEPGASVEAGAWIGAGAVVARGVRVGRFAVVGAGAFVASEVPPLTIAVGRPANRYRRRQIDSPGAIESPSLTGLLVAARPDRFRVPWPRQAVVGSFALNDSYLLGGDHIVVGSEAVIMGRRNAMTPQGGVSLGHSVMVGAKSVLEGSGGLKIGSSVVLGPKVIIATSGHDHRHGALPRTITPVSIGDDVVVGEGAILVGPIRVGSRAVIPPGHVVTRDISAGCTSRSAVSSDPPIGPLRMGKQK